MSDSQAVIAANPLPPELDRWNWGAFLLSWMWGLGNRTYIALFALVPVLGLFVLFALGAGGSQWAWQNRRWDNVEHFRRVQRRWATWGAIVWIGAAVVVAALAPGVYSTLNLYFALNNSVMEALDDSEAYQLGIAELQTNPAAAAALGTPIKLARTHDKILFHSRVVSDGTGDASITFPARGPKGDGTVVVEASRNNSVWTLTRLTLKPDGSDSTIDLLDAAKKKSS
jgi:hypothetical protein